MTHSITRRQFLKASGLAAVSTCAAGLLSSCGGSSASNGGGTGASGSSSTYTVLYDSQPATLNYLTTSSDLEMQVGANCVDTLVEYDNKGVMKEGLATSWDWDVDTLTWTFHLRDENWVDCNGEVLGPVTAQDFVDALAYVLNPDYASSTASLVTPYVAGADDYYNYCVYRNNANNGTVAEDGTTYAIDANGTVTAAAADGTTTEYPAVDFSTVGVKAVDDHTLTYTLNFDFPGFLSLLSYAPYEPAYGPLLEEFADQFCTSAETACSCGAFYLAEYTPLESWVMKKNPENYDADSVYIDTVRYIYNQEELISGPEMVKRGEIDQATISSDILDSWLADDTTKDMVSMDRPNTNYTYFYMFNFMPFAHEFSNWNVTGVDAQYEPDNWAKAVNSTNFRKAFLYAINPSVTLAVTAPGNLPPPSRRGDVLRRATLKALDTLSRNPEGFFLMVEGSNIDKAAHRNNLEEMMEELLDFDRAAGAVLDWASKHPGTLVVITADHNTGAFALTGGNREKGEINAQFGSGNHDGMAVPVYAFGAGSGAFTGIYENTDIFHKIMKAFKKGTVKPAPGR